MRNSFILSNIPLLLMLTVSTVVIGTGALLRAEAGLSGILNQVPASRTDSAPGIELGVFDPDEQFSRSEGISINEYFLDWSDYTKAIVEGQLAFSKARNRLPLMIIEPRARPNTTSQLLDDVVSGAYDEVSSEICSDIGESREPTIVSWGPDMEVASPGKPWSGAAPEKFKAAYRHFVTLCRGLAPNAQFMWAPSGTERLFDYWPGKSHVDYVGVTLLVDPTKDKTGDGSLLPFEELFKPKYERVARYELPILISELGVPGSAVEQAAWLDDAKLAAQKFPLLKALVYFDSLPNRNPTKKDPNLVDWRISNWTLLPNGSTK